MRFRRSPELGNLSIVLRAAEGLQHHTLPDALPILELIAVQGARLYRRAGLPAPCVA